MGVRAKFRKCGIRFGALVVLNFDQTPNACTADDYHDQLRVNLNAHQACKRYVSVVVMKIWRKMLGAKGS